MENNTEKTNDTSVESNVVEEIIFTNTIDACASEMFNTNHKRAAAGKKADVNKKSYVSGVKEGCAVAKRAALEAFMKVEWARFVIAGANHRELTNEQLVDYFIMNCSDFYVRMSTPIAEDNDVESAFFDEVMNEFLNKIEK